MTDTLYACTIQTLSDRAYRLATHMYKCTKFGISYCYYHMIYTTHLCGPIVIIRALHVASLITTQEKERLAQAKRLEKKAAKQASLALQKATTTESNGTAAQVCGFVYVHIHRTFYNNCAVSDCRT
jgi:hypothetical protein